MKKVLILVEGQTEEKFVKELLDYHLHDFGKCAVAKIITTKKVIGSQDKKGGIGNYDKVKNDLRNLLRDSSAIAVTTMIDYYHLPSDFPGKQHLPNGNCYDKLEHLETEFQRGINHPKFIPYLQIHEFEALLFSTMAGFDSVIIGPGKDTRLNSLKKIISEFGNPELIDEGDDTSPAKRISSIYPEYQKPLHGIRCALSLGIDTIRQHCQHFNNWLTRLEGL